MITPTIICNICQRHIHWHPSAGADCVNLFWKTDVPCGMERTVIVEDDCARSADCREVHICRVCEKALATFFKERKPQ